MVNSHGIIRPGHRQSARETFYNVGAAPYIVGTHYLAEPSCVHLCLKIGCRVFR
jgi:hypothetical protein